MKLLLDTHAFLWWPADDRQLGKTARELITNPDNDVLVSAASLWEIVIKIRIGTLGADVADITRAAGREHFTFLNVEPRHLVALGGLPLHPDHRDPFDHLLVAQAIAGDALFVSEDRNVTRYPVRFIACSGSSSPSRPG